MFRRQVNQTVLRTAPATVLAASKAFNSSQSQRIYTSGLPSVRAEYEKHDSLCKFMYNRWEGYGDKMACIQYETKQQMTFNQLSGVTNKFANILYHHGKVRKGTVVCVKLLDHILYAPISYGILSLGGVLTTTNAIATPETLAYHIEKSGAELIICMKMFRQAAEKTAEMIKKSTGKELRIMYMDDFMKMEAPELPSNYTAFHEAKPDDVVFLPFSSGTMGSPKAVQLTNRNLTANILQASRRFEVRPDDCFLSILPFFHIFGFTVIMSSALALGATQIILMKYSADTYLSALKEYKCTGGFVAPPIVNSLVQQLRGGKATKEDFATVDTFLSSSAPLSPETCRQFNSFVPHVQLCQGWGMTEMSPAVCVFPRGNKELGPEIAGCLIPDTELRIVKVDDHQQSGEDKSAGIDCEEGEEGEVWVRGPQMMKGYLDEKDNIGTIQDGWYRTGDIGRFDPKTGALMITDRLKELIKYKGFQVSPAALETEVLKHPWVQDCIVVGVPDPRDVSFEMPRALVVLKPGLTTTEIVNASDDIYRFTMANNPPHKRLHAGVRVVESVPRNATGKLMRRQARAAEVEYMKQQEQDHAEPTEASAAA
uniref:4-coumarate--CoA ligase n=1 Tax=Herpetomonas muscarum TaxID=5718 RepID=T1YRR1_HERMU|nr:4-coumarate--CoA ligase [Herpetomonas muscarum]